jgi:hypothetical protein
MWIPDKISGVDLKSITMKELMKIKNVVNIKFPNKGPVYEIRSHRLLGENYSVSDSLSPLIAKLYAQVPAKPDCRIEGSNKAIAGKIWNYSVSCSNLGPLPFHITVFAPDGKNVPCLSQNIFVSDKGFKSFIPFALNDKSGHWKIIFRNVITGETSTKTVDLSMP